MRLGVSAGVTAVAPGARSLLGESVSVSGVPVTHPDEVTAQMGVWIRLTAVIGSLGTALRAVHIKYAHFY